MNREHEGTRVDKWQLFAGWFLLLSYFVGSPEVGRLKVSFFGPFYGGYNVIDLDKQDYRYSVVAGPDRSYFWILARTPTLDPAVLERLIENARAAGFPKRVLRRVQDGRRNTCRPVRATRRNAGR